MPCPDELAFPSLQGQLSQAPTGLSCCESPSFLSSAASSQRCSCRRCAMFVVACHPLLLPSSVQSAAAAELKAAQWRTKRNDLTAQHSGHEGRREEDVCSPCGSLAPSVVLSARMSPPRRDFLQSLRQRQPRALASGDARCRLSVCCILTTRPSPSSLRAHVHHT